MSLGIQEDNYKKLHSLSRHADLLQSIQALLTWDQETFMPPGSAHLRAEQLKTISSLIHSEKTSPEFARALEALIDIKSGEIKASELPQSHQQALKRWRKDYLQDVALPKEFVEEFSRLKSQSQHVWAHAKKSDAFHQFAPYLEKIIEFARREADYLGYQEHPYDALLDLYEPETTTAHIQRLFEDLKGAISGLLKQIQAKKQIDSSCLEGVFPKDIQIALGNEILERMGFSFEYGRLDASSHPFSSTTHPTDSRITTRILEDNFMSHIRTVLHEAGHSLYGMNLPQEHFGSPLASAVSYGMHESQSRFWETCIGQSRPFWQYYLPIFQEKFEGALKKANLDQFYKAINRVEPDFIRVEADEVTYPLHVILRFELEKALIEGSLKVRDVPAVWNEKMQELLGVKPPTNRQGCLQDVHWSMGAFGYFPSYTLGNIYAAQFFEKFAAEHPNWKEKVAKGELAFISAWLKDKVHQHGRQYLSDELIEKATGQPITSEAYNRYLQKKYSEIYAF